MALLLDEDGLESPRLSLPRLVRCQTAPREPTEAAEPWGFNLSQPHIFTDLTPVLSPRLPGVPDSRFQEARARPGIWECGFWNLESTEAEAGDREIGNLPADGERGRGGRGRGISDVEDVGSLADREVVHQGAVGRQRLRAHARRAEDEIGPPDLRHVAGKLDRERAL